MMLNSTRKRSSRTAGSCGRLVDYKWDHNIHHRSPSPRLQTEASCHTAATKSTSPPSSVSGRTSSPGTAQSRQFNDCRPRRSGDHPQQSSLSHATKEPMASKPEHISNGDQNPQLRRDGSPKHSEPSSFNDGGSVRAGRKWRHEILSGFCNLIHAILILFIINVILRIFIRMVFH